MEPSAAPSRALEFPSDDAARARPLCVDLDGTLVGTNTTWEAVVLLLRRRPAAALRIPLWWLAGKARFRQTIAERSGLDPAALPYREDLVAELRRARDGGRPLVLTTSAHRSIAEGVAAHLGLFDSVIASDGDEDLVPEKKLARLTEAYGTSGFDYVGNSDADLALFERARRGYLVSTSSRAARAVAGAPHVVVTSRRPSRAKALVKALRVHQWAKNALVVVPVLLAPGTPSVGLFARALLAMLAFSLCASAGYVLNDLLDLEADRAHATKKARPFASGALPVAFGPPLFVALLVASFVAALALLPPAFSAMLALYFVGTVTYSLYLKRVLLLDVLVLAGLYTHRILAGGVATAIPISQWLLAFSMFIFLSLAFAKRHVELAPLTGDGRIKNRDYFRADLSMVASMGTASGYLAVLVFTLYVENAPHGGTYRTPAFLWLAAPVLLYWVSRVWILTGRGQMNDDPVKFALTDRVSLLAGALVAAIAAAARFVPKDVLRFLKGG